SNSTSSKRHSVSFLGSIFVAQRQYHTRRHHALRARVFESLVQQHGERAVLDPVCHMTSLAGVAYFDCAARKDPNCGGSGSLVFLIEPPQSVVYQANYLDTATTYNEAEYDGLITALQLAQRLAVTHLTVRGDSMLLMQQIKGIHRVQEARAGARAMFYVHIWEHHPREFNQATDHLSKLAPDDCTSYAHPDNGRHDVLPAEELLHVEELLAADVQHTTST
ncbi:hypothetical protein SDRG_11857, partial [Saprolegnia diclina VS20]